jgi:putative effector of murein hydrolase
MTLTAAAATVAAVILLVLGLQAEAKQTFNIDMQRWSKPYCHGHRIGKQEHVVGNGKCHTFDAEFPSYAYGWGAYDWTWDKLENYG